MPFQKDQSAEQSKIRNTIKRGGLREQKCYRTFPENGERRSLDIDVDSYTLWDQLQNQIFPERF